MVQNRQNGALLACVQVVAVHLFVAVVVKNNILGVVEVQVEVHVDCLCKRGNGVSALHFKFSLIDVAKQHIQYSILDLGWIFFPLISKHNQSFDELHVVEG